MKIRLLIFGLFFLSSTCIAQVRQPSVLKKKVKGYKTLGYFKTDLKPGRHLGTIFMRTSSITGDGFTPQANRVSGTGDYTVTASNADSSSFEALFTIDGFAPSLSTVTISDSGKTIGFSGKKFPNREASGLVYNPAIWGTIKGFPKKGDEWTVNIDKSWELGGAGKQLVSVIYADHKNFIIILKREGSGEGFYDNEPEEMIIKNGAESIKVKITPGTGHWNGYTTIQRGLIISDELMATRPLTLITSDTIFHAIHREYIMLNATLLSDKQK
ncbi:MAG: hypothetical protein ABI168_07105 [Ginsengibacter sp.]